MKERHFSLDPQEQSRTMKILQLIFGIICILVTVYYLFAGILFNQSGISVWVAFSFLLLFGVYQIMAGFGKTKKYFAVSGNNITFKQHAILPAFTTGSGDISRIELFPLSINFQLKNKRNIRLRFGISYPEIIDPVKQEVIEFAGKNNIPFEVMDEDI